MTQAVVTALLFIARDPDRPSVVAVRAEPPAAPVELGAAVWSLIEQGHA
jgi:hypothetical protein